jgi:hypothetical protein
LQLFIHLVNIWIVKFFDIWFIHLVNIWFVKFFDIWFIHLVNIWFVHYGQYLACAFGQQLVYTFGQHLVTFGKYMVCTFGQYLVCTFDLHLVTFGQYLVCILILYGRSRFVPFVAGSIVALAALFNGATWTMRTLMEGTVIVPLTTDAAAEGGLKK